MAQVTIAAMKDASFLDTVRTVLWAFIGIRRRDAAERARVKPVHIVVIAVVFVILFILTIRTIVRMVVS